MTTQTMTDVIKLQETVVELNGLLDAYRTLLDSAKQQLEALDVSEAHLKRLEMGVAERLDCGLIVNRLANNLLDLHRMDPDTSNYIRYSKFVDAIVSRVNERLADDALKELTHQVTDAVRLEVESAKASLFERIETKFRVIESDTARSADARCRDLQYSFRNLLRAAYDPQELNQMAASCIQQEEQ
jgi:hypothetical protein